MNDVTKTKRPRRPSGSRNVPCTAELSGALDGGTSSVEELKDEMEEWASNLESNSMEHLPKYDEVNEAKEALESAVDALQSIDTPEFITDLEVKFTRDTRQSANSRSGRLDNARNELDAALSGAQAWLDDNEELEANDPADPDSYDENEETVTDEAVTERNDEREAVQTFVDELESAISELDNVSFPGMY
jgi:chromosome segregation ATPase